MAEHNPNATGAARVEFWHDDDGPVIDAEAFLTAFAINFYRPAPGQPDEPARILPAEEFWRSAHSLLEGASVDRDVAATQGLEELRCAVEEAVRAGRLIPRYEDTLEMRAGMRGRRKYAPIHRVFFERAEFMAFVRIAAPTIAGGPVANPTNAANAATPDAEPAPVSASVSDRAPSALIGPGSPLWARKHDKLRTPWTEAENADLLGLHDLLKARGIDDPTATLAAELGLTDRAIRNHLSAAKDAGTASAAGVVIRDGKRST